MLSVFSLLLLVIDRFHAATLRNLLGITGIMEHSRASNVIAAVM